MTVPAKSKIRLARKGFGQLHSLRFCLDINSHIFASKLQGGNGENRPVEYWCGDPRSGHNLGDTVVFLFPCSLHDVGFDLVQSPVFPVLSKRATLVVIGESPIKSELQGVCQ